MSNFFKIILLVVLLAVAYMAITPYRTVQKLTYALENEDPVAVDAYVDFDAVKASMQNDFVQKLGARPQGTDMSDRLATSLTGTFLNMAVSPQAMVMVFSDKSRRDAMGLSMDWSTLFASGQWVNLNTFVLKNRDHQPTILLTRTGIHWQVTALRFK